MTTDQNAARLQRENPEEEGGQRHRVFFAITGLILGAAYWLLGRYVVKSDAAAIWTVAFAASITVWGLVLLFAWNGRHARRLVGATILLTSLFAPVTYWVATQGTSSPWSQGRSFRMFTWAMAYWVTLYVLVPFTQVFQHTGRLRFPYAALFFHSWNNFFIAFIAVTFTGVFWGLLVIWAALFHILHIELFSSLFFSSPFATLATTTMIGLGIAIGRETERVTNALRRITLTQFRVLLPMLVGIVLMFILALPVTGVQPLWDTRAASLLLLGLVATIILFLNAVLQDGEMDVPARWLRHGAAILALATPILCALAIWAIGLRVQQHGLTPRRIYVVVGACILTLYSLSYAVAVAGRGDRWVTLLRPVNVAMALLVAALAFLLHTPVLDPIAWSARNQESRLLSGAVPAARFDYSGLRRLGATGLDALERLAVLQEHPEADMIRQRASAAGKGIADSPRELESTDFVEGSVIPPPELLSVISRVPHVSVSCKRDRACALLAVDLIDDGEREYCLIAESGNRVYCWYRLRSSWTSLDLAPRTAAPAEDLIAAFRQSGAMAVTPPVRDLQIGTTRFAVTH